MYARSLGNFLSYLLLLCNWLQYGVLASEMNTLMGVKGRDFVLLGGDSAFFRSVVVMDTEYRKVVELSDNVLVAASGDQGDVEMFVEWLKRNMRLMQLESSRPVGVRTLANFARRNLAEKLRKQGIGQAVTALLGGWDKAACKPELFWLDALGSLQSVPFGAHGLALTVRFEPYRQQISRGMSLDEARDLMEACFRQLDRRYLVSSVGFSMMVVDKYGCRDVACKGHEEGRMCKADAGVVGKVQRHAILRNRCKLHLGVCQHLGVVDALIQLRGHDDVG